MAAMLFTALPTAVLAQGLAAGSGAGVVLLLTLLRVVLVIVMVGAGFALGWFCSPEGRALRRYLLMGLAALIGLIILFNGGALGWGLALTVGWVGGIAAFAYWFRGALQRFREPPTTFGSAKWADTAHLLAHNVFGRTKTPVTAPDGTVKFKTAYDERGMRLGHAFDGSEEQTFFYKGDRHLLTVAPTRSGKGTTQIVPNLLGYWGSALVIDPKGENAMITARHRRDMGHAVHVVDPWGIATGAAPKPSRFNPLDWLVAGDVDITENAMLLADAMIVPEGGNSDAFWTEEAKALLQGIILYVATDEDEAGQRHLPRVRDLLLLDGTELKILFNNMVQSPHHIVASTGARCLQKEERLLANVIASAQAQTHFLDSARIRESLSASDFTFEDLKTIRQTVYLVLPADRLHAFGRWLRLLVQQAITVNARNIAQKPDQPVLFILDEMPALGRLAMIEQAYGLMAGFGMQLWGVVQDLSQLKTVYGEGWETFIGNSGVVQYFGSTDRMTAEYFSSLCGETTVWNLSSAIARTIGTSAGPGGGSNNASTAYTDTTSATQRKLAYPDELMRMQADRQLVFIENMNPIQARKVPWFEDERLRDFGVNLHAAA